MSHIRSTFIYKLSKLFKYLRGFTAEDSLSKYLISSILKLRLIGPRIENNLSKYLISLILKLRSMCSRNEGKIVKTGRIFATFFAKLQRSLEESLFLSSMYMGLLLTMALTVMVVLIYVIR